MPATIKNIFFFQLCIIAFISCKKPHCFDDAGNVSSQLRVASSFNQIDIFDNINLILTQDTVEKLLVEAGGNILANIKTEISNNVLTIKNATDCKWLRNPSEKINVYLSIKDLIRINYEASGNITSTNIITADGITFHTDNGAGNIDIDLNAKRVYVYIFNDNTDMIFRGSSDSCYAYTGERGTIDFRNFEVKHQKVGYGSIRDGYVHATESLDVIMYFKGTLFYKGNPARVTTEYLSTGEVIPLP